MNDLVQRLATGNHRVRYSRADEPSDLKAAIDRGYVLLRFTETRGGTELGVPLDVSACDWAGADFEAGQGKVHLEGDLKLDYVRVRVIADVDVGSLEGSGRVRVLDSATQAAS